VAKASDWLREERRKVLGDWVAFCLQCGAAQRWFDEFEAEVAEECQQCGGRMLRRCPSCNEPFSSTFAVDCESCGVQLRSPELFGTKIRRG
jgi:rRNA maturation endonuclease Nob1